jgi:starch synthase
MNILFAANEAFPVYKLGGLGDVIGSLPKYLDPDEFDVRIIIPYHQEISVACLQTEAFFVTYNHRKYQVTIHQTLLPNSNVPIYLVHNAEFLSTSTDASDNHADKYAFFSLAVAVWLDQYQLHWQPHLVHLHDWHVGLIPVILKHLLENHQYKFLLTIHNLAYQANTITRVDEHLHLPSDSCQIIKWDKKDMSLNLLMEGILHSDLTSTVSPTYAKEIITSEYSFGLDDILRSTKQPIPGILNGLDLSVFNPNNDYSISEHYSQENAIEKKHLIKKNLLNSFGMSVDKNSKLIIFIGRIDPGQKGIQLLIEALNAGFLPPHPHQFVFLGTGDLSLEKSLHQHDKNSRVHIITRFDEPLSHQLYAASDLTLIPSSYEPCGLVQMIAMRYGSLPVARATGGLKDTINHQQNGFLFPEYSVSSMIEGLTLALTNIQNPHKHTQMVQAAMNTNFDWHSSALEYQTLYRNLL